MGPNLTDLLYENKVEKLGAPPLENEKKGDSIAVFRAVMGISKIDR